MQTRITSQLNLWSWWISLFGSSHLALLHLVMFIVWFVLAFRITFLCLNQILTLRCFSFACFEFIHWTQILIFHWYRLLIALRSLNEFTFFLNQVKLLGTKYWSRSCNSRPTNETFSTHLEMFHNETTNKSSCSP